MVLKMQGISNLHYQPLSGIQLTPAMHNAAKILADMGREEDTYIVHAAEGETVIPMEVMEANPKMAEMVYEQLREMGLDPERYIVGNELNSINPETGMPEFFLSKLWKGIKKVAKVVLPIVATVFLASMGVPVPVANAITSGASTMIQGGSFKDGLKSAAIGYATGVVAQGVATGINQPAGTSLGERASAGFSSMGDAITAPLTPQPQAFTAAAGSEAVSAADPSASVTGGFTDQQLVEFANSPMGQAAAQSAGTQMPAPQPIMGQGPMGGPPAQYTGADIPALRGIAGATGDFVPTLSGAPVSGVTAKDPYTPPEPDGFMDKARNFYDEKISPSRFDVDGVTPKDVSLLKQYGPIAGLGTLGVAAMGGFEEEPMDFGALEEEFATTGEDLLAQQPEKYGYNYADFVGRNPYFQRGAGSLAPGANVPPVYDSPVVATPSVGLTSPGILANTPMAQAFYARAGGAINGAGTGTSDSIPAMLSDGEFVFTAKAVRGAGDGDRIKGAREMYRTMKRLEGAA